MKHGDRGPRFVKDAKTGVPTLVGKDTDLVEVARTCLETVVMDQYDGMNPDLVGKTRLEATLLSLAQDAADGVPYARTELIDRVMGKPTQKVESKSTNVTLVGFLDQIAQEENIQDAEFTTDEEFLN